MVDGAISFVMIPLSFAYFSCVCLHMVYCITVFFRRYGLLMGGAPTGQKAMRWTSDTSVILLAIDEDMFTSVYHAYKWHSNVYVLSYQLPTTATS
ncbi:uncharacterized protein EI97DRAFT_165639 [Westerdykella ornata]|uniref:Uncharacterized protein n=1 Tax=Westerdykella ornata TaxID=318751 RepID=A0A6A6JB92_WESOR|nr:uncharacterized protein EI97DRAFT_165639 [Westerdykella ornata]KAF2273248.1 hypothetical protein EI97DRAFT_165639 [Westerdykella ornata]